MESHIAHFRFYEELNDFLPESRRKKTFPFEFSGKPSVKDIIESLGIPHTEVDLILVNSQSVGFDHHICHGDQISVYPIFEKLEISNVTRLRPEPLRNSKFILDVHLGKLARLLRMLGFDTIYKNDYDDMEIIKTALEGKRIILTRDRGILKNSAVTHGCFVKHTKPIDQIKEIIGRLDLYGRIQPFFRCIECNGIFEPVEKEKVIDCLLPKTARYFDEFHQCVRCEKIYWKGSHYKKMKEKIEEIMKIV